MAEDKSLSDLRNDAIKKIKDYVEEKPVSDKKSTNDKKVNKIRPCAVKYYDENGEEKIGFAVDFTLKQGDYVLPSKYFTVEENCFYEEKFKKKKYENSEIWTPGEEKIWKPYQLVVKVFGEYNLIDISNKENVVDFLKDSASK